MKATATVAALFLAGLSAWAQVNFTSSDLPIAVINTFGVEVPDEPKIPGHLGLIYNGPGQRNYLSDPFSDYDGAIGIELRGSTSQFYDKKPFSIELRDAAGEDLNASLLGMPEESDWALVAPFNDKTLMRDALAHAYARATLPWSPRTRYCEVVLNGQYIGVYMLVETIKRDAQRVNIKKLDPDDISGNALTGGYILRMDKYGPSPGSVGGDWPSAYAPTPGAWQETWFQYHYPKAEDIQPEQANYIRNYLGAFEDMLAAPDYGQHYADWIDVDTWIDYLLVQELAKNTDGYRLSAYFYKQRDTDGGKIAMGPIWDFNISLGIGDYCGGADYTGWALDFNTLCPDDGWIIHFWWAQLWNDPAFQQRIAERWAMLRAGAWSNEALFGVIDSISTLLAEAQTRNFERWPIFGQYVWPNAFIGENYAQEVDYLRTWLQNRLGWLDAQIPQLPTGLSGPIARPELLKVWPNPTRGDAAWVALPDDGSQWTLALMDLNGRILWQQTGSGGLRHLAPGHALPPGIYLCRAAAHDGRLQLARIIRQ